MTDITLKEARNLISEAEMRILGICSELERKTGLTIADISPHLNWFSNRDEDDEFDPNEEILHWSELANIRIEMNWMARGRPD